MEEELHLWILPKGSLIEYEGIPYFVKNDTEIIGNTDVSKINKFVSPTNDELRNFLNEE